MSRHCSAFAAFNHLEIIAQDNQLLVTLDWVDDDNDDGDYGGDDVIVGDGESEDED